MLLSDEEAVAVNKGSVDVLRLAVKGGLECADDRCVLEDEDILVDFVDAEPNAYSPLSNEIDLIYFLVFVIINSVLLLKSWLKLAEAVNYELLELFVVLVHLLKQLVV